MTDEDIIQRLYTATGLGKVNGPYGPYRGKEQPIYHWTITKRLDALPFLREIYPIMGIRRKEQIDAILTRFHEHVWVDKRVRG